MQLFINTFKLSYIDFTHRIYYNIFVKNQQKEVFILKTAVRSINMTDGSLWDKILFYALPIAATGILQQLFNAADIAVVGNFTGDRGEAAMAAVGANSPIIGLIVNAFIGISLGSNVVIAKAVGHGDSNVIKKAIHTSVLIALIIGIFVSVFGEIFAEQILLSQNVPEDVIDMAVLYFRVYMTGVPVILLYNFESAIFRGIGNTKTPLAALTCSGLLNVLLNLFFVCVLHMTVNGVALATVISNAASSALLFIALLKNDADNGMAKLKLSKLKIDAPILKNILRIGVPAGIQSAVFSFANIIIQGAINSLGTIVMAASSAAFNIETFAYYVFNSFSQACTTFTGQNYGAEKIDRCKKSFALCYLEGIIATAAAIGIILLFGHQILSVFNPNPEVIKIGYDRLVIIFSAYFFSLSYEVMSGYMRGFGISLPPALLTMIGICGVRITWIRLIFPKEPTFRCIMTAFPISLALTSLLILFALICTHPAKKALNKKL